MDLGQRISDEAVDVIEEEYKRVIDCSMSNAHVYVNILLHSISSRIFFLFSTYKVEVSSDNISENQLVLVKMSEVEIQSNSWNILFLFSSPLSSHKNPDISPQRKELSEKQCGNDRSF